MSEKNENGKKRDELVFTLRQMRAKAVPLVSISTLSPQELMFRLLPAMQIDPLKQPSAEMESAYPVLSWDCASGLTGLNKLGGVQALAVSGAKSPGEAAEQTRPLENTLDMIDSLPERSVVFVKGFADWLRPDATGPKALVNAQSVANLRDRFKKDARMLILLDSDPALPASLRMDVEALEDNPPTPDQIASVIRRTYDSVGVPPPDEKHLDQAVQALRGLAIFPVEQACSLSIKKSGMDTGELWKRKKSMIQQIPGMSFVDSPLTLDDMGGLYGLKEEARSKFSGKFPPSVIVWLDEIEKMMSGSASGGGDIQTSGSSIDKDVLQQILTSMSVYRWKGIIFCGPAGTGKTLGATAYGRTFGCPTVSWDLNACKGSYVGESERNVRLLMKTTEAIGGDRVYVVATSNQLDILPPELLRRFVDDVWFFDLPSAEERDSIWQIRLSAHDLPLDMERPNDTGWNGSEIDKCCYRAADRGVSLVESARKIIPQYVSHRKVIDALRQRAAGNWMDASTGEPYVLPGDRLEQRSISVEDLE